MTVSSLSPYGTGPGLKAWSLVPQINALTEDSATALVGRAQRILQAYGPWRSGEEDGDLLLTDLVYYSAEALYFLAKHTPALSSPFRSEKIGSYFYDKGARNVGVGALQQHEIVWPLILFMRDVGNKLSITTRLLDQEAPTNPETGIRDVVLSQFDNRVMHAIRDLGLVSDTDEYRSIVYGY